MTNIIDTMEKTVEQLKLESQISDELYDALITRKIQNVHQICLLYFSENFRYIRRREQDEIKILLFRLQVNREISIQVYEKEKQKTTSKALYVLGNTIDNLCGKRMIDMILYKRLNGIEKWENLYKIAKYYEVLIHENESNILPTPHLREIKNVFKNYGVDIDNEKERKQLVRKYEKELNITKSENILEKTIYDMQIENTLDIETFYQLSKTGWYRIIDILKEITNPTNYNNYYNLRKISLVQIGKTLEKYKINIHDKKQLEELIGKYNLENKIKDIDDQTDYNAIIEKIYTLENENNLTRTTIQEKKKLLNKLKKELEKKQQLEKQLAECNEEYDSLIKQFQELDNNKNYGIK